ncbi:sigma-70 family RNA polymerase sigma factor [Planomicrobium chinense]|uniref:sigma-70 family RNA polymerase sigma factor n=1 Tax=Planococcus chinensis TaxID=272917 RepID=UPI001CC551F0|nr:sigma-70 family RNA polymerase sigma factor [Planococcus chinensis]MBZ5199657.1 sigma-70 family RNA polymerase sigma factor [Planococcus chinensis]MCP2034411.1 RNA polymerase sigma factor (sigma-70 family) [Planomicrobium sp. HSC-17F08]
MPYTDAPKKSGQESVHNQELLVELYEKYERLVYSFAYRIAKDTDIAEVAVQKVFMKLWQSHHSALKDSEDFLYQLLALTRKTALEVLKEGIEATASPEELPEWQEKGAALSNSLLHLTAKQKKLLRWFYFEGLSQYAIAKKLNIPQGTVHLHIREAIQQLRPPGEDEREKSRCIMIQKLPDYFNLQMAQTEKEAFEEHLAACIGCQTELAEWEALTEQLPYLSELQQPPAGMKELVLTAVFGESEPAPPPQQTNWLPALAAVAVLSVGANTYLVSRLAKKKKARKRKAFRK